MLDGVPSPPRHTGRSAGMTRLFSAVLLAVAVQLPVLPALAQGADASAGWSEADLSTAAALRDRALKGTSAYDHVSSLVTEVGPRLAGSPGDEAAVRWAMNRLGKLGFSGVRTQDVLVPHWVRGTTEVTLLGSPAQTLVAATLGGSIGTGEEGIEAQVVEVEWLEALRARQPGA